MSRLPSSEYRERAVRMGEIDDVAVRRAHHRVWISWIGEGAGLPYSVRIAWGVERTGVRHGVEDRDDTKWMLESRLVGSPAAAVRGLQVPACAVQGPLE